MNSFSIATLGARTFPAVAALTAARKLPLRITCLGEARYAGNDPDLDSCTLIRTVDLGQCSSLDDAIACVERLSGRDHLETGEGDAVADDVEIVQAAPAPAAGGTTWLTEPAQ